ncbi:DNA-3-methyladenine glycosylase I [Lactobacillus sp. ESL0791]|uniref:DNA-3-methyladenine glycosylase I n=1 Tax=Lactobacillus sp. ESL0791 TaxID=2983234 RepID=UPI0023FA2F36|nr:DNA-3-methyladenine glycosylase I [Lactobacillus sp. ESL0791]MDF7638159.1 DNA-3-methyladenine glycosylase I [Lactobacillus sp. ESL0791]
MEQINNDLRCPWARSQDKLMQNYHDHEWGKLNLADNYLYEMLVLEAFQSGLNWAIVLHKRENFRQAFKNFVPEEVAQMTADDLQMLLENKAIIRNKMKITAAINNAKTVLMIQAKHGSFTKYLQSFIVNPIIHHPETLADIPPTSELATRIAKQMKKDGFSFVGPVTTYSFLQGVGLINDHLESCPFKYKG